MTKSFDNSVVKIYHKATLAATTRTELLKMVCGSLPLNPKVLDTGNEEPLCYYDPSKMGYNRRKPVDATFLKPKTQLHGIPTDGTAQFEIRFDISTTRGHAQEKAAAEAALKALFNVEVFTVLEAYDTTSGDIVVRI